MPILPRRALLRQAALPFHMPAAMPSDSAVCRRCQYRTCQHRRAFAASLCLMILLHEHELYIRAMLFMLMKSVRSISPKIELQSRGS
jgi:hypothetical protein